MRIKYSTDIFNNKTTYKNGKKKGIEQGGNVKFISLGDAKDMQSREIEGKTVWIVDV